MKNVYVIIIIHYSVLIHYLYFSFSQVHLAMLKSAPIQISVFPNTLLLPPLLLLTLTSSLVLFTQFFQPLMFQIFEKIRFTGQVLVMICVHLSTFNFVLITGQSKVKENVFFALQATYSHLSPVRGQWSTDSSNTEYKQISIL